MSVLIIRPIDKTTEFLEDILSYINSKADQQQYEVIRIQPNDESHENCIKVIESLEDNSTIVFLGHGTSYSLSGAKSTTYHKRDFIRKDDFKIFRNKKLFFLSCKSEELLKSIDVHNFIASIGFGDLPTEWEEIIAAREYDIYAYSGMTERALEQFRKALIDIIKYSLVESINNNLSFSDLFLRLKLRLNKLIFSVVMLDKSSDYRVLSNLLYQVKNEMKVYGKTETTFLK